MSSLLYIASRVEAAVKSYISVLPHIGSDKEWRDGFDQERRDAKEEFHRIREANQGTPPALHPTLAALFIILGINGKLSKIGRNYPHVMRHKYYNPKATFPDNISDLLPPYDSRWWEVLAAKSLPADKPKSEAQPESHPAAKRRHVRLLLTSKKAPIPVQTAQEDMEDVDMVPADDSEVDQLQEDELVEDEVLLPKGCQTRKRGRNTAERTCSWKRKGSSPPSHRTTKHRAGSSWQNPQAEHNAEVDTEVDVDVDADAEDYKFECDRCLKVGVICEPDPLRPCKRCQYNKQGCSLMPVNRVTGKTDRRNLNKANIFRFRVSQLINRKKQQSRECNKAKASGSRISPAPMHSSHSPPAASDSPVAATAPDSPIVVDPPSDTLPPPAATGLHSPGVSASQAANFSFDVPPVAVINTRFDSQASSAAVSITPAPTTAAPPTPPNAAATIPTTAAFPVAGPSSAMPNTPITDSVPAGATTISTINALNDSAPSSRVHQLSPMVDSSSSAFAPTSPFNLQRMPAPVNLAEHTVSLAQVIEMFEDWMRRDEKWKEELDARLQVAGI